MAWKRAKVPEMATEPGISLQRPSPRFWRGFWAAAILLVPIGVLVDRYTDLDLDKLTLYGAFVAAIYGGIQVYQARLDSLRPVLLGNEVQFARLPARPNAPAREEVGISLRVKMCPNSVECPMVVARIEQQMANGQCVRGACMLATHVWVGHARVSAGNVYQRLFWQQSSGKP